jgi:predicted DNA-binding transcriptional regulator AlpA
MARIDTALQRLLNQFEDAEDMIELFRAIFNRIAEADALLEGLLLNRWLDTAEGVWLDIIGAIVGVPRPAGEVDPSIIFTYRAETDVSDPNKGYGTLPQVNAVGLYNSLFGLSTNEPASDDEYRQRIRAKVAVTGAGVSYPDIYRFIRDTFEVEPHLSSPYVGRVEVELEEWISNRNRLFLVESAPVSAGVEIEITNWPVLP